MKPLHRLARALPPHRRRHRRPVLLALRLRRRHGAVRRPAPPATAARRGKGVAHDFFRRSFDIFTVMLVAGSSPLGPSSSSASSKSAPKHRPEEPEQIIRRLAAKGSGTTSETSSPRRRLRQPRRPRRDAPAGDDMNAVREAASSPPAKDRPRFRKIEMLNVRGNLGPLMGLAGTVWGMVIAFAALRHASPHTSPANLSLGISKALFHTLLGLLLALPALAVFGYYRTVIDRLCTRAMVVASELVELLPADGRLRRPTQPRSPASAAARCGAPSGSSPVRSLPSSPPSPRPPPLDDHHETTAPGNVHLPRHQRRRSSASCASSSFLLVGTLASGAANASASRSAVGQSSPPRRHHRHISAARPPSPRGSSTPPARVDGVSVRRRRARARASPSASSTTLRRRADRARPRTPTAPVEPVLRAAPPARSVRLATGRS